MKISVRSQFRTFFAIRFNGNLTLRNATSIAFEEARANGALAARAAEKHRAYEVPLGHLDHFAVYFAMRVPLWGKHPQSRELELIDVRGATKIHFIDGARSLTVSGKSSAVFTDVQVAAKDFYSVIDTLGRRNPAEFDWMQTN